MLKRKWKRMWQSRAMLWTLLLCLAAGAAAGTAYKNSRNGKDIQQAQAGEERNGSEDGNHPSGNSYARAGETSGSDASDDRKETRDQEEILAENETGKQGTQEDGKTDSQDAQAAAGSLIEAKNLDFLSKSTLSWPVEGEVLTEFNMDETVYFPTLNLYRCSEGMVIQSEEGTPVSAPADGVVLSIARDEQLGNYLVLDIGDDYQVKLGQLKDIKVKEGDSVKAGDLIAYVAAPAECYSVEGDNLYLSLTAEGKPVDPLDYLKYQ